MSEEFPIHLKISATDKATSVIHAVNKSVTKMALPAGKIARNFVNVGKAMGGVGKAAMGLGLKMAGLGAAAAFGLNHFMRGAVETGDKLGEVSQRLGLTVDGFASLQHAAAQADVSQEAFTQGMDAFNKSIGQAKAGTGRFASFLKHVSPALLNQIKHTKSTEEAFDLMTSAIGKVEDPAKRAALATAAFGNAQMGQFLGQGTEEIKKQRAEYLRLAGSQEEFARRAGILDNTLRDTETAFAGLRNGIAAELFPAFNRLAIEVTKFITQNRDGIIKWAREANGAFQAWANGGGFERTIKGIQDTARSVSNLIDKLGGLKGVAIGVGAYMGIDLVSKLGSLALAFAPVAKAIWGFGVALMGSPIGPFLLAATALSALGVAIYENWEPLKLFFQELSDAVGGFSGVAKGLFTNPLALAGKVFDKVTGNDWARPTLPTGNAAPQQPSARQDTLDVNFNNAPKGTRVVPGKNNSPGTSITLTGMSLVIP